MHSSDRPSWIQNAADLANMFKAFLGSNYLAMAFSIQQSGLLLGLCGLVLIATLTDHCCQLIVTCKEEIVGRKTAKYEFTHPNASDSDVQKYRQSIENKLSYGDIGRIVGGKPGLVVVNFFVVFTQFSFCIGYSIFIGNTIKEITLSTGARTTTSFLNMTNATEANVTITSPLYEEEYVDTEGFLPDAHYTLSSLTSFYESGDFGGLAAQLPSAPPLWALILVPLPVFLLFSLLRSMRQLSPFSVMANFAIFGGFVAITIKFIVGFTVADNISWYANWKTFPIFFGAVTSAYEGIGLIIPLQSSMEGNRHLFKPYLHTVIISLTFLFGGFGSLGYLRHGSETKQLVNLNLAPSNGPVAISVDITLCLAILFTFPMQLFPVIEILESFLFGIGSLCGPSRSVESCEHEPLIPLPEEEEPGQSSSSASIISPQVPTWKRNILRLTLVICSAGIAVACRDMFAYLSSFAGAVGSTMLAYVLPCIFHIHLKGATLPRFVIIKDIVIVFSSHEDCKAYGDKDKPVKISHSDGLVERFRRLHLNDIENIFPFVLLGGLYLVSRPSHSVALYHFRIFAAARFAHTLSLIFACQPWRSVAHVVCMIVNVSMTIQTLQAFSAYM